MKTYRITSATPVLRDGKLAALLTLDGRSSRRPVYLSFVALDAILPRDVLLGAPCHLPWPSLRDTLAAILARMAEGRLVFLAGNTALFVSWADAITEATE